MYQSYIDKCICLILTNVLVYIDDIIVHSPNFKQHLEDLEKCFIRLRDAGLKLKPSKCHLFKKEVKGIDGKRLEYTDLIKYKSNEIFHCYNQACLITCHYSVNSRGRGTIIKK